VRPAQPDGAAELCTPDAVRSAEQSCAALEAAAGPSLQAEPPDELQPPEHAALKMRQ